MSQSKKLKVSASKNNTLNHKNSNEVQIDSEGDSESGSVSVTIKQTTKGDLFDDTSDGSSDEEELIEDDRKPAWEDDGDTYTVQEVVDLQGRKCKVGSNANKDYKKTLESNFQSIVGAPKWAKRKAKLNDDSLLTKGGRLVKKSTALGKGRLDIQEVKHLNQASRYTEGNIIKSVLFHPTSSVALIAGSSGSVSIVQVDGNTNEKLQTIQFKDFPINCVQFANNGEDFIVGSSKYPYYYRYSMMTGKSFRQNHIKDHFITNMKHFRVSPDSKHMVVLHRESIHLFSAITNEYITEMRMNCEVHAVEFIGSLLLSHGCDGEVYIWDLNTRECIHKFLDEGCIKGTTVAMSPNGRLLACGSNTGVVNIYDAEVAKVSRAPTPLKTVLNLQTSVSSLKFNSTSEVLAMASDLLPNAIKLLHCSSMTVFSNFPSFQAKYNRSQCLDFSPNSGFMALGDNKKTAHLFRLNYYGNY